MHDIQLRDFQISKDLPQQNGCTVAPYPTQMSVKFTKSIKMFRFSRINQTSMKLNIMPSGYCTPKLDACKVAKMLGVSIERAKKSVLANSQNYVQDVTRLMTE